jgi:hypothetical protein
MAKYSDEKKTFERRQEQLRTDIKDFEKLC